MGNVATIIEVQAEAARAFELSQRNREMEQRFYAEQRHKEEARHAAQRQQQERFQAEQRHAEENRRTIHSAANQGGGSSGNGGGRVADGGSIAQTFNDSTHGADAYRDYNIDLRSPAKKGPRFHASGGGHIHGQTHWSETNGKVLEQKFDHIAETFEARQKWIDTYYAEMVAANLRDGQEFGGRGDRNPTGKSYSVDSRGKEVVFAYRKAGGVYRELSGYPLEKP